MNAPVRRNYLLGVLLVILAANYMDQLTLGLVLQNIKGDLHLSDMQLGVVSGIAFALFYSIAGIPIARWADRGNRVTVIAVTGLLWSVLVAVCSVTRTFWQLIAVRVGVAVGEAGCIPPAHSLIADYFKREERPRAVGIYLLGNSVSIVVGYFLSGWINEWYGWRAAFAVLGLLGIGPAILAWCTLQDPRYTGTQRVAAQAEPGLATPEPTRGDPATLREVWATLWSNRSFRHLLACFSVVYFFGTGISQWQPAFFIRQFGLQTGPLGTWLAVIYGGGGLIGTYLGGALASRFAAGNESLQLSVMAITYCLYGVLSTCVYLSSTLTAAFCFLAVGTILGAMTSGPLFATLQTLIPARMRALSIALVYLFANFIGLGLGPLAAGALSDLLHPHFGPESLRYALLTLCPGYLWVAWHLRRASRTVGQDLSAVEVTA